MRALHRVGAQHLGEWHDWTGRAYHVRRRLHANEQAIVGDVKDIRRTDEAMERLAAIAQIIPRQAAQIALQEIGGRDG